MKRNILPLLLCLLLVGKAWSLSPKKEYKHIPHDFHMTFEELSIPVKQGVELNAWYFPSSTGDQLMIISHDGVGNMGDYLERVRIFVKYGFSVITYDYRGFGSSSEFNIDPYNYVYKEFYDDFDAVYKYCEEKFHHEIIAYGWGIGAGISLTRGFSKDDISGIIADEPFVDFSRLKVKFVEINSLMKLPTNLSSPTFNSLDVVTGKPGKNLRGILYLHGMQNFLYSTTDMEQLMNATNFTYKELYLFEKASRMDNFTVNESEYAREIYTFTMNL